MNEKDFQKEINCPLCDMNLSVESVRYHTSGRQRVYWECKACSVSIMHRGTEEK